MAILLREALQQMDKLDTYGKPVPFSCVVCTYSRQRKEGGKIVEYSNVILTRAEHKSEAPKIQSKSDVQLKRQPSNFKNKTRNIKLLTGDIKKFRIRFLLEFNGETVVD